MGFSVETGVSAITVFLQGILVIWRAAPKRSVRMVSSTISEKKSC